MTHKCGSIVVADSRVVGHQCGDAVPYFVNPDIGESTATAISKFQAASGLPVTGVADPETQKLLLEGEQEEEPSTESEQAEGGES